jgi:hypothetical protein
MDNNKKYLKKYLKYKKKYLYLKKQIGSGTNNYYYESIVPEFKDKTKEGYVSDKPRNLNTIIIQDNEDIEKWKGNIILTIDSTYGYLPDEEKGDWHEHLDYYEGREKDVVTGFFDTLYGDNYKNYIIYLDGFYNTYKDYKTNINEGTVVLCDDKQLIFKDEHIDEIEDSNFLINDNKICGFNSTKGVGKKHLKMRLSEYKDRGFKYIILMAGGGGDLISYYKRIGFIMLFNTYYYKIEGITKPAYYLMVGNIDDIIEKL